MYGICLNTHNLATNNTKHLNTRNWELGTKVKLFGKHTHEHMPCQKFEFQTENLKIAPFPHQARKKKIAMAFL